MKSGTVMVGIRAHG